MTEKMAFWAEETLSFDKKEKLSSVLRRYASYLLICQFALQPVLAQAQMVPDQSDPSKAPTIDSAPNGVPVVNITRPSASGVSQNRFTEFNVDAQGVILNNSASHGTSQLGGVLLANPNLGGQEARIIVNEVTGSNASQLRGFTEIFGGQAQYVLSNSNGIYCNGCGFINTPRATLTTGQAQYNDGNLTGLDVENSSQIDIDGLGLNAQDIAALDLVARSVRVNAPVNAQDLRVFTGRNLMDYGARTVTVKADDGSAKPALALDGALFGGMYARRIEVIATEDGVGVKMPDDLAAGTGDITITADGGIALKNLSAKTGTTLSSANGDINITGGANGGSSLSLSASNGAVATDAAAVAGALDTVTVTARSVSNNGRIVAGLDANANGTANGDLQITASQDLNNGGTLTAGQDLTAQAADITSTGLIQAGNINSLTVANNATLANLSAGTRAEITATNGNVTVNETVNGGGETVITATNGTVATGADGVIAALDRVTVDAANITNQGEISAGIDSDGNATATGALTLKASQKLTNSHYITSGDSLTVQADEIDNDEGYLLSVGAMTLEGTEGARATAVVNQSGTIETATGDILIRADALSNKRKQFTTGSVKIFDRSYSETSGNPPSNPPGAGISGAGWAYLTDGSTVVVPHPDRGMAYASYYDFGPIRVRQYEVQVTATSAASMLSSGNNLTVDGGTITNEYSAISAKGDIALTGTSLQNTQVNLTKDLYFTGPNGNYNRCVGGPCQWFGNGGGTILVERSTYDTVSATIQAGGSLTGSFTGQINNTTISQTVDDTNLQRSNTITSETPYKPSKLTLNPLDIAEEIPGGREILEEIRNFNGNEASVERRAKFADLGTYFAGEDFLARVPGAAAAREISDKLALGRNAEKTLIDGTIVVETGKRWLDPSVRDSEGQMKQLVDNAVEAAGNLQLAFGVSLSAVQIQALTKNIVWYEEQEINGHKVLLPKIYLASTTGSVINDKGTLAAGSDIRLDAGTTLANSGNIEAGNTITLTAQDDLVNSGGRIQSGGDLSLEAVNGDLVNQTETYDLRTKANEIQTVARTKGELISGGDLTLKAGNDVTVKGAAITALGDAAIEAGNNVEIGTIALRDKKESVFEGGHDKSDRTTVEGSSILVDGALSITAGEDLTVRGSAVAAGGDLALKAGDDLTITSDQNTATYDTSRSKKSFWKSSSLQANGLQIEQQSSVIGAGGTLSLEAGDNARITASAVNAGSDLSIKANDVLVDTARDVKEDFLETKRSGFFVEGSASGDGVGFSAGARKEQHKFDTDSATQVVSGLNSGGAITIEATQDAVIDSATLSAAGDVNVRAGNDIDLKASSDTFSHSEEHKIKQAGISVSLKQNVTQAVESVANLPQALTEGEGGAAAQGVTAASAVLKVASAVTALQKGAV
ncbi:hemagglutinin repeat-containing protein, partial [Aestuariispira insulae]